MSKRDKSCRECLAGRANEKDARRRPDRGRLIWALFGRDHHHHLPAFEFRHRFDFARVGHIGGDTVQQFQPQFLVRHLAATESQGDLDLVTLIQEFHHRAHFHLIVIGVCAGTEFDFLDLDDLLLFARFSLALLGLIFVFAKVHNLANGRFRIWRNFHQIQTSLFGHGHGHAGGDDTDIFPICANQADFGIPNAIINARSGFALRRGVVRSAGYGIGPLNCCRAARIGLGAGWFNLKRGKICSFARTIGLLAPSAFSINS